MTVTTEPPPRVGDELGKLAVRICSVLLRDGTKTSAVQMPTAPSLSAVPNASGADGTLASTRGEPTPAASTSEVVLGTDAVQHHLNKGPCVDARRNAIAVQATDLRRDGRRPASAMARPPHNIDSLIRLPHVHAGVVRGAIKNCCDLPGAFVQFGLVLCGAIAHRRRHRSLLLVLNSQPGCPDQAAAAPCNRVRVATRHELEFL